ncbi:MAG: hypothetical protein JW819_01315 [Candidatus Krumholzibacteriota bacterium]|nr:hypothetical protein [Candidatus Krumholzibacteriota bacterium]
MNPCHCVRPAWRVLLPVLAILVLAAPALQADAWRGEERREDGVPLIANPAEPMEAPRRFEPERLWRLGGDDETGPVLGLVLAIAVDEAGNAYVLDSQLNEIHVVSPTGDVLRTIGHEGEGPGEFAMPMGVFLLPDGRLGVHQPMPTRVAVLDREGEGHSDYRLPGGSEGGTSRVMEARGAGGHVLATLMNPRFEPGKMILDRSLVALDGEGTQLATLYSVREEQAMTGGPALRVGSGEEDFVRRWTPLADGGVLVAPFWSRYRILDIGPDGARRRIIERDYEPVRRSREEMDELREQFAGGMSGVDPEIPEAERNIESVVARPGGGFWVLSSRGIRNREPGTLGVFEVYDARGRYERNLSIAADYDPDRDRWLIDGDRLFIVKEGLAMPPLTRTSGNQTMIMRMGNAADDDEEDTELKPLAILCYRLP